MIIKDVTMKHIVDFYQNIRALDRVEFGLMSELRLEDAPVSAFSDCKVLVDDNDDVYAIAAIEQGSFVWMLCTTRVEKKPIAFLRACKKFYDEFIQGRVLTNFAWLGNSLHIKWLKWIGATFVDVPINNFQQFMLDGRNMKGRMNIV